MKNTASKRQTSEATADCCHSVSICNNEMLYRTE